MAFAGNQVLAQTTLKGQIKDSMLNTGISFASVKAIGQNRTTVTDYDGYFTFKNITLPITLKISYFGFESKSVTIDSIEPNLVIYISQAAKNIKKVVIKGDPISEKQREQPLTVESMGLGAIKATPASNFYEGLGHLKGVDVTTASLGFRVINTRGFNSTSPVRSLQLIDGVDNQSPGLNFSLGNFLGASDLDVLKTEIFAGASTAFFGPNAFNGVINMTTKDPWNFPGFSFMTKVGERGLTEFAIRQAQVFKNKEGANKFAYKVNFYAMRALDWAADNTSPSTSSFDGVNNNGGYDAVNRYGDENLSISDNNFTSTNNRIQYPGLLRFYRTGYWEKDLVNYNTRNLKFNTLLAYKINTTNEIQYQFNFGEGNTVYQGENRFSLRDIRFFQHRVEYKASKGFLRYYKTHEDAGNTYDAVLTALLLQENAKGNTEWSQDYTNYWIQNARPVIRSIPGWPQSFFGNPDALRIADSLLIAYDTLIQRLHGQARELADGKLAANGLPHTTPTADRYVPGTAAFDSMVNVLTSRRSLEEGGSGFYDRSALHHLQGQRTFDVKSYQITAGFSSRLYLPDSRGTIFSDTGGRIIQNFEAGVYGGVERKFAKDKIKVAANFRLDKNQNFRLLFSPAASLIYLRNPKNTWRFSFSSAIRNPTLQDQYLFYNVGRAILLGNIEGIDNLITVESIRDFANTQKPESLEYFSVDPIQPEQVRTLEAGYKGIVLKDKLIVDASYYVSFYTNFIGFKIGVIADIDTSINRVRSAQAFRIAANSEDLVLTTGAAIGLTYSLNELFHINGNYSWNELNRLGSTDPLIPAFNTPRHKFNLGIAGKNIFQKISSRKSLEGISFNINYKWIEGFLFEGSPQFTGEIDTYYLLDAQVTKSWVKKGIDIKIGASNISDNRAYQVYGGPQIGRLAYISLLMEIH